MFTDMERRATQLRRATVARSALDVIALIFLVCSFAFWSVAFYQLLAPPQLLHLLSIQVAVLAIVYALATPLLWSALVPTTPAGQLLQKTQWRTFGFAAIIGAAFYLSYQGEMLIETWLYSQPNVAGAGMARSLALSLTIAFVLIPALAWTQLTPERWLQQIQQAHQVRKLEMMQNGEIAIIKSRLLWAEQRAAMSYANLLPTEQKEIHDTLQGLLMGIADTQRGIARTLGISAEIERVYPTMDDSEIADRMAYLADKLDIPAQQIEGALMSSDAQPAHVDSRLEPRISRDASRDVVYAPEAAHVNTRLEPRISRESSDATRRHTTPHDAAYLQAARAAFGVRPFTLKQLAAKLEIGDTSAGELRDAWLSAGQCREVNLGRWSLTESEAA